MIGRECEDRMDLWGGQHSRGVLCGTRVQEALGVQEEWGVDSAGPEVVHRNLGVPGFARMV